MRTATVTSNENYWMGATIDRGDVVPMKIRATNEGNGVVAISIVAGRLGGISLYGALTSEDARLLAEWILSITAGAMAAQQRPAPAVI